MTSTARVQALRDRRTSPGLIRLELYVHPADHAAIKALADRTFEPGKLQVSEPVLREILADCEFMADPRCVDASAAERSAYRGLRDQCKRALSIGPVEQQCC